MVEHDIGDFDNDDRAYAVLVQPDGKVVVVGESDGDAVLVRYTSAGVLDTATFGDNGVEFLHVGASDGFQAVAMDAEFRLVAAGFTNSDFSSESDFLLGRFETTDGDFDPTFNSGVPEETSFTTASYDEGRALAIQSDGKIIVGGVSSVGGSGNFALARYVVQSPPTIVVSDGTAAGGEGEELFNGGTFSDADGHDVTISASRGTIAQNSGSSGFWSWSYIALDDEEDDGDIVTITATDSEGESSIITFVLDVENLDPELTNGGDVTVVEFSPVTNTGTFDDVLGDDVTLTPSIGTLAPYSGNSGNWTWTYTPASDAEDGDIVTITATDDDGGLAFTTFVLNVLDAGSGTLSITKDANVTEVAHGGTVNYTYSVSYNADGPGSEAQSIAVADDLVTLVTPVTTGGFNIGDTDTDGYLDEGETWVVHGDVRGAGAQRHRDVRPPGQHRHGHRPSHRR